MIFKSGFIQLRKKTLLRKHVPLQKIQYIFNTDKYLLIKIIFRLSILATVRR